MTDISTHGTVLPSRLAVTTRAEGDVVVWEVAPRPETCRLGSVRLSVLAYAADAATGIMVDADPDVWTFTSDLSLRMLPVPAPTRVDAFPRVLRRGRRSSVTEVQLLGPDGELVGFGALGFANVPRRDGDPEKPQVDFIEAGQYLRQIPPVDRDLREAAGITVVDAAAGVVEVEMTDDLRNPAGAMQGAMVALVAEAAAEELVSARAGAPALVTDLDVRYLAQARAGTLRTRSQALGDGADAAVRVELVDPASDKVLTHVLARAVVPG